MQFPSKNEPFSTLFSLGRYSIARVLAHPDTKVLAPLLDEPQKQLLDAIAKHDTAMAELINAEAARDTQVDELNDNIMGLSRQAQAHFDGRNNPQYRRLFPIAPSEITSTPARDRLHVYGKLVMAVGDAETPLELRATGKKIEASWKLLLVREKEVQAAEASVERAARAVVAAREGWMAGYRRLHAQLTDKYPNNKTVVERFFRKIKAAKKASAPAPVIHDLIPVTSEDVAAMGDEPKK